MKGENDEYFLTEIPNLIGSETASTRRARKSRAYRENQKVLQCNTNATLGNLLQQNCNTEIEKEIDIELEKEGEIEKISLFFYGEYKNVSLTDEEYGKLKDKMQGHREKMIEKLSTYMQSTGRNYKDHYATLIHWYEQDKGKLKESSKLKVYTFEDYDKGLHL